MDGIQLPESARLVARVTCEACNVEQPAAEYMSDGDQLRRAGAKALANRAAAEVARRDGVRCPSCGATVSLPHDLSQHQFACTHCPAMLLTATYVAPELMMGLGIRAQIRAAVDEQRSRAKRLGIVVAVAITVIAAIVLVAVIFARP